MGGLGTSILTTSRGVMTGPRRRQGRRRRRSALQHLVRRTFESTVVELARKLDCHRAQGRHGHRARRRGRSQGPEGHAEQRVPPGVKFEVKGAELIADDRAARPGAEQVPRPGAQPDGQRRRGRHRTASSRSSTSSASATARKSRASRCVFALGYSHPVVFDIPAGIDVAIDKQTHVTVTGIDRQLVGQVAANIRRLRKPDPVQAEGRALHGRSAEEEGRQDGSVASHEDSNQEGSPRAHPAAAAQADSRHGGAAAAGRVPVGRAHLRAGDRRHRRAGRWRRRRAPRRR